MIIPGIDDNNLEIYVDPSGQLSFLNGGNKLTYEQLSDKVKFVLRASFHRHPLARACTELMGIETERDRIKKYLTCRFGNYDMVPDLTLEDENPDYYDCGNRGACKFEGKLCDKIKTTNGFLTHQEIQIIRHIAGDLSDKQIADIMNIAVNTVHVHVQNILHKTGHATRVGICRFAIEKNLI